MESLANVEPIMERLLTYRFQEGSLAGQSFGNLILAALNGVTGSFEEAVAQMSPGAGHHRAHPSRDQRRCAAGGRL